MKKTQRHSGAERAKNRYYVRLYVEIFCRGFDKISRIAQQEFASAEQAFTAFGKAAQDAVRGAVSDIMGEYIKEKIIPQILADAI